MIFKIPRICTYTLLLPQGVEIMFPRYRTIVKIAVFGHETWPLAKVQKLHIHSLSTPGGRNWSYFCLRYLVHKPGYGTKK